MKSNIHRIIFNIQGKSKKEFLDQMNMDLSLNLCIHKIFEIKISNTLISIIHLYEYDDGVVIKYNPIGNKFLPNSFYSIEVKKNPMLLYSDDNIAFKVTKEGKPIPKSPYDMKNPYIKGEIQYEYFKNTVINLGNIILEED